MRILSIMILSVMIMTFLFLSACETVKGVGRDVESVGETVDDTIDDE